MRTGGGGAGKERAALEAARARVAVVDRSDRGVLEATGRAPVQMLSGIVTSAVPGALRPVREAVCTGRAPYSLILTPKGRPVTDLRLLRLDEASPADDEREARGARSPVGTPATLPGGGGAGERLLLDLPAAGVAPALEHLGRFVPPRFARIEDVSERWGLLTLLGPGGPEVASREALGLRVEAHELEALEEGSVVALDLGGGDRLLAVGQGDVAVPAVDLLGPRDVVRALLRRFREMAIPALGPPEWDVLRVEAGRPAFGTELDEEVIPVEAGVHTRAIDYGKGCYTGQEVIVRIRDRGRVNRHLRGLVPVAGSGKDGVPALPAPGARLFAPDVRGERAVGEITSAVVSPRHGPLALGYVRREVEPGGTVRIGGTEGPAWQVEELEGEGWPPEPLSP